MPSISVRHSRAAAAVSTTKSSGASDFAHQLAVVLVVVDDDDRFAADRRIGDDLAVAAAARPCSRSTAESISRTRKVVPLSFSLSTEISPPSVLVSSWVMVRPRPRPGIGRCLLGLAALEGFVDDGQILLGDAAPGIRDGEGGDLAAIADIEA